VRFVSNARFASDVPVDSSKQAYHEVEVNIVNTQTLKRAVNAVFHAFMPRIIQLSSYPYLLAGDTRVFDALANLLLVAVGKSGVDVSVSSLESGLDCLANLTRLRLPCPKTDSWDLCASVELRMISLDCPQAQVLFPYAIVRTVKVSLVQFFGAILANVRSMYGKVKFVV